MCLADLGPVLAVDEAAGTAEVDLGGVRRSVSLAPLVLDGRPVVPGEWVVVHTGLAVVQSTSNVWPIELSCSQKESY